MKTARALPVLLLTAAVLMCGCAVRYYSATVFGYVRDSTAAADGTQAGINGAEVLVFLEDPALDPEAAPSVRTSTMTSGNQPGYWSHKVMWSTTRAAFADEGDSGTIWVTVARTGYFPKTVKVSGILSDSSNAVSTIELKRIVTTELKGRVVNENGAGLNGVAVMLDLLTTTEEDSDYTATTATVDGVVGVFVFPDVAWDDPDSIPPEPRTIQDGVATENVRIYVDDPNWYSDTNDVRTKDSQTPVPITSGAKVDITGTPIEARSATFSVPILKGRVLASPGTGINGITIAVDLPLTTASPEATVVTATIGSEAGWYQFENLSWVDNRPTHSAAGAHDDVIAARVYLDDGSWYSSNDVDGPIELSLTSGVVELVSASITAGDARFSAPKVSGRVSLAGTSTYENGVAVRLQLASSGQVLGTTTTNISAQDGTFEFTNVQWTDTKPERTSGGGLAEREQARLYVEDADYSSDTDAQSPLIIELADGAAYAAGGLTVSRRTFSVPKVTGTVVTADGAVAGIAVVLDLQSTPDNERDLTTSTNQDGVFVFNNVGWTDDTPDTSSSDTESIALSIEDTSYETAIALPLKALSSGVAAGGTAMADWTITAARSTRWTYSTTLTGRAVYRANPADPTKDITVAGVTVTITSTDAQGGGLVTNASPLIVQTNANGSYSVTVSWSRDPNYVPAPDARANGGDTLGVSVLFSDSPYNFGVALNRNLLSWLATNIVDGLGAP